MGLETGTRIQDLVPTNPVGATDFVSQGDDHIRLLKACLQGSFPSLGATAVAVAAEKLNFTSDVTSAIQAQLDNKQPLDSDLTAIAALTTTSFGRAILALADGAAARGHIGAQADDADLTAIAALTTTSFGRDFLALANLAALATKIAALAPTWSETHTFTKSGSTSISGPILLSSAVPVLGFNETGAASGSRVWDLFPNAGVFLGRVSNDAGNVSVNWLEVTRAANVISSVNFPNGELLTGGQPVALRNLLYRIFSASANTAADDAGKSVVYNGSGGHTFTIDSDLPDTAVMTIVNAGTAALTIANGLGGTQNWYNGSGTIGTGNRSLAAGSICTVWRIGTADNIWGMGLS